MVVDSTATEVCSAVAEERTRSGAEFAGVWIFDKSASFSFPTEELELIPMDVSAPLDDSIKEGFMLEVDTTSVTVGREMLMEEVSVEGIVEATDGAVVPVSTGGSRVTVFSACSRASWNRNRLIREKNRKGLS